MTAGNGTRRFADFFSALALDAVPARVVDMGRWLMVDTLGCLAAGAQAAPAPAIGRVAALFAGRPGASQAGQPAAQGTMRAAYANARFANLLDFDETYPVGVHFGVGAVSAAIAAAEAHARTPRDLLAGVITGYEAGARMACAIGPMMQVTDGKVAGFSPVWGVAAPVVVAACVAYARTAGLDGATLQQALGIAGANIPLPIGRKWSDAQHLPDVKYCDAGWCTATALHGIESALAGLTGYADILDGPGGIPEACGAAMPAPEQLHDGLGARWHLPDLTFKPWPCCRFMHAPLSALDRILSRHGVQPEDIREIIIHTGPLADSRRFRNASPRTFAGHQFSYAHVVAMMALGVPAGPRWFDPAIAHSPAALALREKVRIERLARADDFAAAMVDNQIRAMPGGATVRTDASAWTLECDYADGDPWDEGSRYGPEQVRRKFEGIVGAARARPLLAWLFDDAPSLAPLSQFIRESNDAS